MTACDDAAASPRLGDPVDLTAGLRLAGAAALPGWRTPPHRPLRTEPAAVPPGPLAFDEPVLSLHLDVASLLDALNDLAVAAMPNRDGPLRIGAGALLAGRSLAALEERCRLDLARRPAAAHLLLQLRGRHPAACFTPERLGLNRRIRIAEWLTPEARNALARLRFGEARHGAAGFLGIADARQAGRYLDWFRDFGTHCVGSLTYGAQLFQLVALDGDALPALRQAFAGRSELRGAAAYAMAAFARPPFAATVGPILTAGDTPGDAAVARHAIWNVPGWPPSLLSPRAMPPPVRAAVLAGLGGRGLLAATLACQALFLEDRRADAWSRLMRAGLQQRVPAVREPGWRPRGGPAALFVGAALDGEEALCRPPGPVLPSLALVLDLAAAGPATQDAPTLALFAATGPRGSAELSVTAFDPSAFAVAVPDGAVRVGDRDGRRWCLVEGATLGDGPGGLAVAADPRAPDPALLRRHAATLAGWCRLMARLRDHPGEAGSAIRRCLAWLAVQAEDAAGGGDPDGGLAELRWQAIRALRGAGRVAPDALSLDGAALAGLLVAALDLLALHPAVPGLGAAAATLERQLGALLPVPPPAVLDREMAEAAGTVRARFAALAAVAPPAAPGAADPGAILAAAACFADAPDPRRLPHAPLPGDDPFASAWNAVLALRAAYAEGRALAAAAAGRAGEAAALLRREPSDCLPAHDDLLAAFASAELPPEGAAGEALLASLGSLLLLCRRARLLRFAEAGTDARRRLGPQLRRLLAVLDVLDACRAAGLAIGPDQPPLDDIAPAALARRLEAALKACRG